MGLYLYVDFEMLIREGEYEKNFTIVFDGDFCHFLLEG